MRRCWRDITNAWQLRTRQLACLQLLALARELRRTQEHRSGGELCRAREGICVGSALYARKQANWTAWVYPLAKSAFHGKTLLALVEKAQALPEGLTAADA